jgi:FlgD Ig-like domain/Galactose oxidase, central domain
MKTMNAILCGLGMLLAPALQAQDGWTLKSPATKPSARRFHAMASLGGDQVLLFGGLDAGGFDDETWVYDLSDNTWTLKSPATKPSGRAFHAMASLGGDQVLLFGGRDAGGLYDETWVYDLSDNTWTLKSPATKPPKRDLLAMASLGGDQVLLFGGNTAGLLDDGTWVYDLSDNTWTLQSPATKPLWREEHAMASLGGDQVLLFGGTSGGLYDETWVYDLSDNAWTLKSPATKPSARVVHAMASLGGDQVLLFGGSGANDDETWVYDLSDNTWTLKSPATKPSARTGHAMASLSDGQVLLFGGNDSFLSDETWVYKAMPAISSVIQQQITATQALINNPATPSKALPYLQNAITALNRALVADGNNNTAGLFDALREAAGALEKARGKHANTDPIAIKLADLARDIAVDKKYEALACNPNPTGKMLNDIKNGDKDLAAGDNEYNSKYFSDAIKDFKKAWEDYVKALGRCLSKASREEEVASEQSPVTNYELEQNYPNPFNPSTTISFALPEAGEVKLSIYNTNGQLVKRLVAGEMSAGRHSFTWNATNERGERVASGVYLYVIKAGEFTAQKKLVLMK